MLVNILANCTVFTSTYHLALYILVECSLFFTQVDLLSVYFQVVIGTIIIRLMVYIRLPITLGFDPDSTKTPVRLLLVNFDVQVQHLSKSFKTSSFKSRPNPISLRNPTITSQPVCTTATSNPTCTRTLNVTKKPQPNLENSLFSSQSLPNTRLTPPVMLGTHASSFRHAL